MGKLIPVAYFPDQVEADLARATLAAAGIDAVVSSDDASGMVLPLQYVKGVRLLVREEDKAEAEMVLGGASETESEASQE